MTRTLCTVETCAIRRIMRERMPYPAGLKYEPLKMATNNFYFPSCITDYNSGI